MISKSFVLSIPKPSNLLKSSWGGSDAGTQTTEHIAVCQGSVRDLVICYLTTS